MSADFEARCATLERLAEEVWGCMAVFWIEAGLPEDPREWTDAQRKQYSAFLHVDGRLREAGLKRFPARVVTHRSA